MKKLRLKVMAICISAIAFIICVDLMCMGDLSLNEIDEGHVFFMYFMNVLYIFFCVLVSALYYSEKKQYV